MDSKVPENSSNKFHASDPRAHNPCASAGFRPCIQPLRPLVTRLRLARSRRQPQAAHAALLLAGALFERYAARSELWQQAEFDFLVQPSQAVRETIIQLARETGLMPVERAWQESRLSQPAVQPDRPHASPQLARQVLVERISQRAQRIEAPYSADLARVTAGAAGLAVPVLPAQPAERVFRKAAPSPAAAPAPAPGAAPQQAPHLPGSSESPVRPAGQAAPYPAASDMRTASAPQIDMNQLADQVVQAIDRRIVAQRERMGRF